MSAAPVQTIVDYIALQPRAAQLALDRVRRAIHKAVPDAEECISYSIPAFRWNGRILLYFAGWKEHYSIYPAGDAMSAAFQGELDAYRASKGTLRFPLDKPVPAALIGRIAEFRARAIAARRPAKKLAKKTRAKR